MLYSCDFIKWIWANISELIGFKITFKEIVCGFVNLNPSKIIKTINHIITLISYSIFKANNRCKEECREYSVDVVK